MPGACTESFAIPPLDAGDYELQLLIWNEARQEMELAGTTPVAVRYQNQVPTLGSAAAVVMIALLGLAGRKLLLR